jgi:hypothetical protein
MRARRPKVPPREACGQPGHRLDKPQTTRKNLTGACFSPIVAAGIEGMKQVTIRVELRVSEEMNEFLQVEAQSRKLSFEGLLLMYIEERMRQEREERRHGPSAPRRS